MKTFLQWMEEINLAERGIRSALGPVADGYGASQYPPLYFASISPTSALQLQQNHPKTLKNTNPPPKKKKKKHKKKKHK